MILDVIKVSTHSRLKAAGSDSFRQLAKLVVSTHSRLKAAVGSVARVCQFDGFQHTAA